VHARVRGVLLGGLLALVAGAVALAGGAPPAPLPHGLISTPPPAPAGNAQTVSPQVHPLATLPALEVPSSGSFANRGVRTMVVGRIPVAALAALPRQTQANTITPRELLSGRRKMSATGSTINVNSGCALYGNNIFGNPCTITWSTTFGAGALNGNDNVEDVYLPPNDATTFNTFGTYKVSAGDAGNNQTMSINGTWVIGTYDTTGNFWIDVAYLQVGNTNTLETFSDQYDTVPQTNFTGGQTVYFSDSGLQGADDYAYYIESTSTAPTCVYLFPTPGGNPPAGLCNPNSALSRLPALGVFNGSWPIPATQATGTYSLVLYDTTAQQRVAQIQFSVVKSGATGTISMKGVPGASGTAAPSPGPVLPTPATAFAFDSTTENSDKGITATISGLTNGHSYREIISDPNGLVVLNSDVNNLAGTSTTLNWNFTNNQTPFNYPNSAYTLTVYDKSGLNPSAGATPNPASVAASQAFQILGYNVQTIFTNPTGTALTLSAGGTATSGLEFLNDGDGVNWNQQNADGIAQLFFTTGASGITIALGAGSSSCGAGCQTQTVVDSSGVSWTFTSKCTGAGNTAGCTLLGLPTTAGQSLAPNETYVTLPNITWSMPVADANCANGCQAPTTVLPIDGADWSASNQTQATNYVTINFGNATSWSGTGHIYFIGNRNGGFTAGPDIHGFTPRSVVANTVQGMYAQGQPTTGTGSDVWDIHIKNTSTGPGAKNITEFELGEPPPMSGGNITIGMDGASPTNWTIVNCPNGLPADVNCFQASGGNAGIAPGASQDLYFDLNPGANSSFAYTDFTLETLQTTGGVNNIFTIAPDGTNTVFVGQTNPQSIDSTAIGSYSLDNSLMTGSFAPNSVGSPSSTTVTVALTNAAASGTFPDEIDAIAVDIPTNEAWAPAVTAPASGWSYLGSTTPVAGTTRYWFGLCAGQKPANTGSWNPPNGNNMPSCGTATEQASALQPSGTFNASGTLTVPNGVAGPINGVIWTHGANGDGWNQPNGKAIQLNISATGATAGFSAVYPYGGSVVPVTAPNIPTVGADSDSTYGNTFQYTITNTGATAGTCAGGIPCNSLTKVDVTIPYQDINAITGTDSTGIDWQVTPKTAPVATVTINGGQAGGKSCTATVTNPLPLGGPTANGLIDVTGGATCYVAPGDSMTLTFNAQAPYKVNDVFKFPATFSVLTSGGTTTNVTAAEAWTNDTEIEVVGNASLVIVVNPGVGPGSNPSHPVPNCGTCTFGVNNIVFNVVPNNQTVTGTDLATVSVYTNVGNPAGWGLYVSTNNNPANSTGSPTNELLTEVDSANSSQGMGLGWDATSYTVIPTSGNGSEVAHAPTTVNATRQPFDIVQSYRISVGNEAITPQTSVVTYTWIEN